VQPLVTAALLARTVDYGESDRICDLLTATVGKVSALARGGRRSRKRFGGALSLFVIGEATLRPGRGSGRLLTLERFDAREDLASAISGDLVKVAHGSYMLELARELWPPHQPEPDGFELICQALRVLAREQPSPSLLRAYELQLLVGAGLDPCLDRCVSCGGQRLGDPILFNAHRGGVVCPDCGPRGWPLSPGARSGLISLARMPLAQAAVQRPEREAALQMRDLMLLWVRHQLGRDLKTLQFIEQLRGGAGRGGDGPTGTTG
jgi:DNA repair protein RecO (recombination protein O)